jgi:GNAT superfamily N-acetyltransferase
MALSSPHPINERHQVDAFDSGVAVLDDWLKRRARANQSGGASRSYVVCDADRVVAYYAIAAGAVEIAAATSRVRRNMPDPVPVAVLGRLAIERGYQGKGLGRALVKDALSRVAQAADIIGIRGVIVHAISPEAKAFYLTAGLEASRLHPMTLMATLADVQALSRRGDP